MIVANETQKYVRFADNKDPYEKMAQRGDAMIEDTLRKHTPVAIEFNPKRSSESFNVREELIELVNILWKADNSVKIKSKIDGTIDFINGNKMFLSDSIYNHQPKKGDVILFPHYLMHTAYPFKASGERRSFSFNLEIDKKIANVFSK